VSSHDSADGEVMGYYVQVYAQKFEYVPGLFHDLSIKHAVQISFICTAQKFIPRVVTNAAKRLNSDSPS
jgi:hypothetical protein